MAKGPEIVVEQKGAGKAAVNLHRMGVRASDVGPVADRITDVFRKSSKRRFDAKGPGWPPLAESTKERKARQGQDPRILRATERLYRSLTSTSDSRQHVRVTRTGITFGTKWPHAKFTEAGTKTQPKRELIELRPSERKEITRLLGEYLKAGKK